MFPKFKDWTIKRFEFGAEEKTNTYVEPEIFSYLESYRRTLHDISVNLMWCVILLAVVAMAALKWLWQNQ